MFLYGNLRFIKSNLAIGLAYWWLFLNYKILYFHFKIKIYKAQITSAPFLLFLVVSLPMKLLRAVL